MSMRNLKLMALRHKSTLRAVKIENVNLTSKKALRTLSLQAISLKKVFLACMGLLIFSMPALAIRFGTPDNNDHPNVGCMDVLFKDQNNNLVRHGRCSTRWLVYHDQNKYVFMGAGHSLYLRYLTFNTENLVVGICLKPNCNNDADFVFSQDAVYIDHPSYTDFSLKNGRDISALVFPAAAIEAKYPGLVDMKTPDSVGGIGIDSVLQACKNNSQCVPTRDIHFKIVGYGNTVSRVNIPGQGGATPQPSFDWPNIRNASIDAIFQGIVQPKNDIERVISTAAHYAEGESAVSPGDSGSPLILLDSSGNELETIGVVTNINSFLNPGFVLSQDLSPQSSQTFIQCIKKAGTDSGETYTDVVNEINPCGHKPTLNP